VLVTDIDPRHLASVAALAYPQVTIQQHDIASDPLPEKAYDLIHARLVLLHVSAREQALTKLVAALKPGGWFVVEDFDLTLVERSFPTEDPAAGALFRKVIAAIRQLMAARGIDPSAWGRQLYARLRAHGLEEVGMEGHLTVWPGGPDRPVMDRPNFEQMRADVVARGLISEEEIAQAIALLDDPTFVVSSPIMMSAWGRRPS
jgi:SAM-dependent methyltransferase